MMTGITVLVEGAVIVRRSGLVSYTKVPGGGRGTARRFLVLETRRAGSPSEDVSDHKPRTMGHGSRSIASRAVSIGESLETGAVSLGLEPVGFQAGHSAEVEAVSGLCGHATESGHVVVLSVVMDRHHGRGWFRA